jgi:hypothetical protein
MVTVWLLGLGLGAHTGYNGRIATAVGYFNCFVWFCSFLACVDSSWKLTCYCCFCANADGVRIRWGGGGLHLCSESLWSTIVPTSFGLVIDPSFETHDASSLQSVVLNFADVAVASV